MKRTLLAILAAALLLAGCTPKAEPIAVNYDELMADPDSYLEQQIIVTGEVHSVERSGSDLTRITLYEDYDVSDPDAPFRELAWTIYVKKPESLKVPDVVTLDGQFSGITLQGGDQALLLDKAKVR